jgi:hypothetical protein
MKSNKTNKAIYQSTRVIVHCVNERYAFVSKKGQKDRFFVERKDLEKPKE